MSSSEYQREYDDLRSRGYIVKSIGTSSAITPDNSRFAAVWNDGSFRGYKTHHGMTSKELDSKTKEYGVLGHKIIQLSGYNVGDSSRYAAIWSAYEKSDIMVLNDLTSEEYQDRFDELKTKGYRIVYVNAHNVSGKVCFFGIWKSRDAFL
ncbi:MAG: hypothetical protein IPG99_15125 [Ignavibacteria bacterium]|nr:hypothetical protein [Ignavibacteria bacterium]